MLLNENRTKARVEAPATDLATNVAGEVGDLVFDSTNSVLGVCTVAGAAGAATWVEVTLA